mmetsp:Transcript_21946/g.50986  ORF Transcript_21946/g.50986 Transcript_21946/m.50986 type:complete len:916 (-) Transcript_21946:1632-4379(-)
MIVVEGERRVGPGLDSLRVRVHRVDRLAHDEAVAGGRVVADRVGGGRGGGAEASLLEGAREAAAAELAGDVVNLAVRRLDDASLEGARDVSLGDDVCVGHASRVNGSLRRRRQGGGGGPRGRRGGGEPGGECLGRRGGGGGGDDAAVGRLGVVFGGGEKLLDRVALDMVVVGARRGGVRVGEAAADGGGADPALHEHALVEVVAARGLELCGDALEGGGAHSVVTDGGDSRGDRGGVGVDRGKVNDLAGDGGGGREGHVGPAAHEGVGKLGRGKVGGLARHHVGADGLELLAVVEEVVDRGAAASGSEGDLCLLDSDASGRRVEAAGGAEVGGARDAALVEVVLGGGVPVVLVHASAGIVEVEHKHASVVVVVCVGRHLGVDVGVVPPLARLASVARLGRDAVGHPTVGEEGAGIALVGAVGLPVLHRLVGVKGVVGGRGDAKEHAVAVALELGKGEDERLATIHGLHGRVGNLHAAVANLADAHGGLHLAGVHGERHVLGLALADIDRDDGGRVDGRSLVGQGEDNLVENGLRGGSLRRDGVGDVGGSHRGRLGHCEGEGGGGSLGIAALAPSRILAEGARLGTVIVLASEIVRLDRLGKRLALRRRGASVGEAVALEVAHAVDVGLAVDVRHGGPRHVDANVAGGGLASLGVGGEARHGDEVARLELEVGGKLHVDDGRVGRGIGRRAPVLDDKVGGGDVARARGAKLVVLDRVLQILIGLDRRDGALVVDNDGNVLARHLSLGVLEAEAELVVDVLLHERVDAAGGSLALDPHDDVASGRPVILGPAPARRGGRRLGRLVVGGEDAANVIGIGRGVAARGADGGDTVVLVELEILGRGVIAGEAREGDGREGRVWLRLDVLGRGERHADDVDGAGGGDELADLVLGQDLVRHEHGRLVLVIRDGEVHGLLGN